MQEYECNFFQHVSVCSIQADQFIISNIHTCNYIGDWAERGVFPGDSPHTVNVFKVAFQFCYTKSDTNIPHKVFLIAGKLFARNARIP